MNKILQALTCAICAVVTTSGAAALQPPGSVLPIFVDYEDPPSQIEQLISAADAVAVVRVEGSRFESRMDPKNGHARDFTTYDLRIVETIKPSPIMGPNQSVVTVTRLGGQHTQDGKVFRTAVRGFEDFQQNAEYVLFLGWNKQTNEFDIAYGPNGCYRLEPSGTVRSLGRSGLAEKQHGKTKVSFLNELRAASTR